LILTVLIGNSRTRFVWFQARRICRKRIIPSVRVIEYLPQLKLNRQTKGASLASVVPKLTLPVYRHLCQETPTLLVTAATKTPLRFHYDRHALGTDRVCAGVAGFTIYRRNLIIIDFGTAITINVVTKNGDFLGGPILPGVEMMLSALAQNTSRLAKVPFAIKRRVLSSTTKSAIQAGVFNLLIGGLEHIIKSVCLETRDNYFVIATGGFAQRFKCHLSSVQAIDEDLASKGLAEIFYLNKEVR